MKVCASVSVCLWPDRWSSKLIKSYIPERQRVFFICASWSDRGLFVSAVRTWTRSITSGSWRLSSQQEVWWRCRRHQVGSETCPVSELVCSVSWFSARWQSGWSLPHHTFPTVEIWHSLLFPCCTTNCSGKHMFGLWNMWTTQTFCPSCCDKLGMKHEITTLTLA